MPGSSRFPFRCQGGSRWSVPRRPVWLVRAFPEGRSVPRGRGPKLRTNAFSIVANAQPKGLRSVADFDFNMARMRVLERVSQGLSRDAVELAPDDGAQVPNRPFHRQIESRPVIARKFVASSVQRF